MAVSLPRIVCQGRKKSVTAYGQLGRHIGLVLEVVTKRPDLPESAEMGESARETAVQSGVRLCW